MKLPHFFPYTIAILIIFYCFPSFSLARDSNKHQRILLWLDTPHFKIKWIRMGDQDKFASAFRRKDLPPPTKALGRIEIFEALRDQLWDEELLRAREYLQGHAPNFTRLQESLRRSLIAWKLISSKRKKSATSKVALQTSIAHAHFGVLPLRAALIAIFFGKKALPLLKNARSKLKDAPSCQALDAAIAFARLSIEGRRPPWTAPKETQNLFDNAPALLQLFPNSVGRCPSSTYVLR